MKEDKAYEEYKKKVTKKSKVRQSTNNASPAPSEKSKFTAIGEATPNVKVSPIPILTKKASIESYIKSSKFNVKS